MSKLYKSALLALSFCLVLFAFAQDTITTDQTDSGVIGAIAIGQTATGTLESEDEEGYGGYHTYYVDVPEGTETLTIRMEADMDFDLAAKYGSEIEGGWDEETTDYLDTELENFAEFVIQNPQAGLWYIDVLNLLPDEVGTYTLTVK